MSTTIVLAVDAQHYAPEATELARQLSHDTGDEIFVLISISSAPEGTAGCRPGQPDHRIIRVRERGAPQVDRPEPLRVRMLREKTNDPGLIARHPRR